MGDTIRELEAEELAEKPYDASDPEQVNAARKRSGRKVSKERDTLKALLEHENGREFLYASIKCIIDGDPVVPGDSLSTYFNLGQERRARHIFQESVRISPENFAKMIKEAAENNK